MVKELAELYKGALIRTTPVADDNYYCFFDESSHLYLAIRKEELPEREREILKRILKEIHPDPAVWNATPSGYAWYRFLTGSGEFPGREKERIRFIHFRRDGNDDKSEFLEPLKTIFQEQTTVVWFGPNDGAMIEPETPEVLSRDDIRSMVNAILSDFYSRIDFYIGRFYEPDESLKGHFHRERFYFSAARAMDPSGQVFSFESAFPLVIMATEGHTLVPILKAEFEEIFQNDRELLMTIKTFLENNSNVSLTAKKLYLHRNSLQYRIDKFIERTSIDIKAFQGAVSVYYICLFGESQAGSKND